MTNGTVVAVHRSSTHSFSKASVLFINLIAGLGIEGDAHMGATVQHRSRVAKVSVPNLRQVHLIHNELFEELGAAGFQVRPGELGENITTQGLPLLELPRGTRLHLGTNAIVEITGLRNPCRQIDAFQPGLLKAVLRREVSGAVIRKAGIMAIVIADGIVTSGDQIRVELPAKPWLPLAVV